MKFFDALFHKTPPTPPQVAKPAPLPDVTVENHFEVKDGVLCQSAETLEEFHANQAAFSAAGNLLGRIQRTEGLKQLDGSKQDFDNRPGHVVLLDEGFEWHSDTKALFQETPGQKVEVDGDTIKILLKEAAHSYQKNSSATWNTKTGEFTYRRDVAAGGGEPSAEADELPETGSGTFKISADGKVEAPGARSLAEARDAAPQREMAQRAEALLDSYKTWSERAQKLDQGQQDVSPKPGSVVATNVSLEQLGITGDSTQPDPLLAVEQVIGEYHDETSPYTSYDVENSARRLRVGPTDSFDEYGTWNYRTELSGSKSDSELAVTLRSQHGTVETVKWNLADGTVQYRKQGSEEERY